MSGYLGQNGVFEDLNGQRIGKYALVYGWKTPNSHVSDRMYQVEVIVNGVLYTGRSAGVGMLFNGRMKKSKPSRNSQGISWTYF